MTANWQPKPIYCPRRHGIECDTPNACAGGADCRFGPDPYAEARALFEAAKRANDRDSADRLSRMALAIAIAVEREGQVDE